MVLVIVENGWFLVIVFVVSSVVQFEGPYFLFVSVIVVFGAVFVVVVVSWLEFGPNFLLALVIVCGGSPIAEFFIDVAWEFGGYRIPSFLVLFQDWYF